MTSIQTAAKTRKTWMLFEQFVNEELDELLKEAGIKPCKERSFKIHQALVVWYHGDIPNLLEIERLAREIYKDK